MTKSFRELIVWQKSIALVVKVYKLTEKFPKSELFGLTSQIRRAVVAIPSNIAEGYARRHTKEYAQFVNIAFSSGAELETQLVISEELGYVNKNEYEGISETLCEIMRMLNKLGNVLRANL
ncbi:MAG: four helix bundle protein [Candidatus Wolfebacteria bacterium]|nr:four helix bundle protein [Candidatus Wolfebacteria bacterium]